jgi:hypothetical protein
MNEVNMNEFDNISLSSIRNDVIENADSCVLCSA